MTTTRQTIEHVGKLNSMEKRPSFLGTVCSGCGRTAVILAALFLLGSGHVSGQDWVPLWDGQSLEGWQSVGDGLWSVTPEGYLMGQRDPRKPPSIPWSNSLKGRLNRWFEMDFKVIVSQAWLYTVREFTEYDLHLEWWLPGRTEQWNLDPRSRAELVIPPATSPIPRRRPRKSHTRFRSWDRMLARIPREASICWRERRPES